MIVILSFVIIILLHELGHYLVARCFGVAVARFSIGFGRPIFLWRSKKQLTKFTFAPILLGGFVQFAEKSKKNYRLFSELASWKKILILLAGPAVNLLIAMAVLSVVLKADIYEPKAIIGKIYNDSILAAYGISSQAEIIACNDTQVASWSELLQALHERRGNTLAIKFGNKVVNILLPPISDKQNFFKIVAFEPYVFEFPPVIGSFTADSPAKKQGLEVGDRILSIEGIAVNSLEALLQELKNYPEKQINLVVLHGKQKMTRQIQLGLRYSNNQKVGFLGIRSQPLATYPHWFHKVNYSWSQVLTKVIHIIGGLIKIQALAWKDTRTSYDKIAGPIGIIKTAQESFKVSINTYLFFIVWLNVGIFFLNLLPIPILDGGQCLIILLAHWFPAIEKKTNKDLIVFLSIVLVFALFILGTLNDMQNIIH